LNLILLPEAQEDQRQAVAFYRTKSLDLAQRFMRERIAVLKRIVGKGNRRAMLSVFPYAIIFREMPGFIAIVAVAHTSRDTGYWNDRDIPDTL
jgi:hypothetical protein